uniref:Uncharacterized protein n=1 Tax=Oncorhynchus tshawytscha TaxID=74940 RepID=A0AAZ3Q958_ONCTS
GRKQHLHFTDPQHWGQCRAISPPGTPVVGNTWKFLLGMVAITLTTSMLIVCAVKTHLGMEHTETSAHELDHGQDGLGDEEGADGYIEDHYIETGNYKDNTTQNNVSILLNTDSICASEWD